jgi:hypothetical protein
MSSTTYVKPDSVLARTAREVVEAHAGGAGPRDGMTACPVCGQPLPCSTGRAAAEVLFAAGLAQSSGLVEKSRGGLGPAAGQAPFGAPAVPYPATPAAVLSVPPNPAPAAVTPHASAAPAAVAPPPAAAAPPAPAAFPAAASAAPPAPAAFPAAASAAAAIDVDLPGDELDAPSAGFDRPVADFDTPALAAPVEAPPAVAEPEPTEEIDPLLLGPPIYDRQNRPLDAPQFTPSARAPGEPAPAPGSWPDHAQASPIQAPAQPAAAAAPTAPAGWAAGSGPAGWAAGSEPAPTWPAAAPRPPLADPQSSRPPQAATPAPPEVTQAVPVAAPPVPPVGHQTTTAPLRRPARPPLEPPQMGQLNRPLPAPPASPSGPADQSPSGLAVAPSGLAAESPSAPTAEAPSGLPMVSGADQTPAPSGLWGVSRSTGTESGLPGVPPAPVAWAAAPDAEDPEPSGLPLRPGGDDSAS